MASLDVLVTLKEKLVEPTRRMMETTLRFEKVLEKNTKTLKVYEQHLDRVGRAHKKARKEVDLTAGSLRELTDDLDDTDRSLQRVGRTANKVFEKAHRDGNKLLRLFRGRRGFLGGFSGFVIFAISGLLSQFAAALVAAGAGVSTFLPALGALSAGFLALAPALAASAAGFGLIAAVAIPVISKLTEKYQSLSAAKDKVNKATTMEEREEALKELRDLEKGLTPFETQSFARFERLSRTWKKATAPVRGNVESVILSGLSTANKLIGPATPAMREFGQRFQDTTNRGLSFLTSPGQIARMQQALAPLPILAQSTAEIFGRLALVFQDLVIAASPLSQWILDGINEKLQEVLDGNAGDLIGQWTEGFNAWKPLLSTVWHLFTGLLSTVTGLVVAIRPFATVLLRDLSGWLDKIATPENFKRVEEGFMDWVDPVKHVAGLLKDIFNTIIDVANGARPFFDDLVGGLRKDLLPALETFLNRVVKEVGPQLPGLVDNLARLIELLAPLAADILGPLLATLNFVVDKILTAGEAFREMNDALKALVVAGGLAGVTGLILGARSGKLGPLGKILKKAPVIGGLVGRTADGSIDSPFYVIVVTGAGGGVAAAPGRMSKIPKALGGAALGGIALRGLGGIGALVGLGMGVEALANKGVFGDFLPGENQEANRRKMMLLQQQIWANNRNDPAKFLREYREKINPFFFGDVNKLMASIQATFMGPLPKMAMGGITSGVSLVGEDGSEAVIPLNRRTNQGQKALGAAMSVYGSGSNAAVHIDNVVINNGTDMQEFVNLVENAVKRAQRQLPRVGPEAAAGYV